MSNGIGFLALEGRKNVALTMWPFLHPEAPLFASCIVLDEMLKDSPQVKSMMETQLRREAVKNGITPVGEVTYIELYLEDEEDPRDWHWLAVQGCTK